MVLIQRTDEDALMNPMRRRTSGACDTMSKPATLAEPALGLNKVVSILNDCALTRPIGT